jgi:hypothetical protein
MPTANNTGTLNQQYYDQCLQPITENMELRLDDGLELGFPFETWMDESVLLRMDPATRLDSHNKAVGGGWFMPNEARRSENMPPVPGGDTPYLQQQNYSLAALNRRDTAEGVGTQVTALQGLIAAAAKGEIPVDTVRAAIAAAFPLLTPEQIDAMCKPLDDFEPPAPPAPPPVDPPPDHPEGEDGEEESEEDLDSCSQLRLGHYGSASLEIPPLGHSGQHGHEGHGPQQLLVQARFPARDSP